MLQSPCFDIHDTGQLYCQYLDAVSTTIPVFVLGRDLHCAWLNTVALEQLQKFITNHMSQLLPLFETRLKQVKYLWYYYYSCNCIFIYSLRYVYISFKQAHYVLNGDYLRLTGRVPETDRGYS